MLLGHHAGDAFSVFFRYIFTYDADNIADDKTNYGRENGPINNGFKFIIGIEPPKQGQHEADDAEVTRYELPDFHDPPAFLGKGLRLRPRV
jgi:hypothetical protein